MGATKTFAITVMGPKYPDRATKMGAHITTAAIGGLRAPAIFTCTYRASHLAIRGARRSSPAVANTDSAKPGSRACQGSPTTTAAMAKPSAGNESLRFRAPRAKITTLAIAAARNTDGEGRTNAMKHSNATVVTTRRTLKDLKNHCMHHNTKREMIAKLAPLTAVK
ncbi:unannotated protein [freshwater metagenome]|uniref:Unannotated protein n=1 Tax=freshwater metagenome TaxID=449393 RepID=A0A6J7IN31_9ZZZZ